MGLMEFVSPNKTPVVEAVKGRYTSTQMWNGRKFYLREDDAVCIWFAADAIDVEDVFVPEGTWVASPPTDMGEILATCTSSADGEDAPISGWGEAGSVKTWIAQFRQVADAPMCEPTAHPAGEIASIAAEEAGR